MPKMKPVCPFTNKPCSCCKALFTATPGEKSGPKLRGCQLLDQNKNPR